MEPRPCSKNIRNLQTIPEAGLEVCEGRDARGAKGRGGSDGGRSMTRPSNRSAGFDYFPRKLILSSKMPLRLSAAVADEDPCEGEQKTESTWEATEEIQ